MYKKAVQFIALCFGLLASALNAQEFKLFDRDVQVHGFASQGFIDTNHNNWLSLCHSSTIQQTLTEIQRSIRSGKPKSARRTARKGHGIVSKKVKTTPAEVNWC